MYYVTPPAPPSAVSPRPPVADPEKPAHHG
jgi:hypothetical protein